MKKKRIRLIYLIFIILAIILIFRLFKIKDKNERVLEEESTFTKGVDISRYQGDVDFDTLYNQNINFAFIKATEGVDYIDPNFLKNWENGKNSNVKIGAYHFYRFEYSGKEQGENFIKNVTLKKEDLPPVIDLEYYGEYVDNPAPSEEVKKNLHDMIDIFYNEYNKRPIIYCNRFVYDKYISGEFPDIDIWFRYVHKDRLVPELSDGREWTFWQFDDEGQLEGYGGSGASKYIDLNYFNGSLRELERYGR